MRRIHSRRRYRRREMMALLAAGMVVALDGAARRQDPVKVLGEGAPSPPDPGTVAPQPPVPTTIAPAPPPPPLPPVPPPHPGAPVIVAAGRANGRQVAITIDDGTSDDVVGAYVEFAERTGIPITFSPNGVNRDIWAPRAKRLSALIANGQVQIANHTWSHPDLRKLPTAAIKKEIDQNERWIEDTFGITARPWFRPPFGFRNARTDGAAAEIGYTRILMWNGTLGDATVESVDELMGLARRYFQPGTIMLGHANHPTVTELFDKIQVLLAERDLEPVTIDTMFGSSRATG